MSISYDNLWILLSQKGLKRTDLCEKAGITTNVLAKMGKNESVQVDVLSKICGVLECTFDDIISNTGENSIISPIPIFKLDDLNIFEYSITEEFETLGLKTLKDFPKPHTVNNIKKTLVRYIKECKLSLEAVNALLGELEKYNIIINIDKNVAPEYERIPKKFSNDDAESKEYEIEYQQVQNYLYWFLDDEKMQYKLKQICQNSKVTYIEKTKEADLSKVSYYFDGKNAIKVVAPIIKMYKQAMCFPYNLIKDVFHVSHNEPYSFLYQHNQICEIAEQALKNLTVAEEATIRSLYIDSKTIHEVYESFGLPNNNILKTVFNERLFKRSLRKLRHPRYRGKLSYFYLHDEYSFICPLNDLCWSYLYSKEKNEIIYKFLELEYIDHILSIYSANISNCDLFIVESLYKGDLQWHLLLVDYFDNIFEVENIKNNESTLKNIVDHINCQPVESKTRYIEYSCEELDLSVRSYNCLKRAGIRTLDDVISKTEDELMLVRNLGRKSLDEVIKKVKEYGYHMNSNGIFEYFGIDYSHPISVCGFAQYYMWLYSRNKMSEEKYLIENFFERCISLGFSLEGADWFIEMFSDTKYSLNDINIIDKINNSKLLGSLILKKWRHITHWTSDSLLSKENRIWFIVAFNRLYQIGLEETKQ